ncbi:DUF2784 domain-containing protein [Fodinibius salicampi]|uniref:DUF2784 domain-containing protein n=2 Tax=Fodinibius salicampi TaxID=1920655 RepID=UPI003313677E
MYELLNIFFLFFHTAWMLFNLFGWIWKRVRKWNLLSLLLTAFSWFGLGIWYGLGYCPCTHWHWLVRRELGYTNMPSSYIKFLIQELTAMNISAVAVDWLTGVSFGLALILSVALNIRDYKQNRRR